jgi:hypothetical protein
MNTTRLTLKRKPPAASVASRPAPTFRNGAAVKRSAPVPARNPRWPVVNSREFWFVWSPAEYAPKKRHASRESAMTELARLQALDATREFIVYHD